MLPKFVREPAWHAKEWLVRQLVHRGFADALHARLREQFRSLGTTLVLDVGANHGQSGRLLRRLGYRGRIVSFEPQPHAVRVLEEQARRDGNWQVVACGIGDDDGRLALHVMAEDVFSSFLPASAAGKELFEGAVAVKEVLDVSVRRLDSILPELGIDLHRERGVHLKVDTQGFDMRVIRSAGSLLPQIASIQIELDLVPQYEGQSALQYLDELRELGALGYELVGLFAVAHREGRLAAADALLRRWS
jgi:FkbM family methyltransferase